MRLALVVLFVLIGVAAAQKNCSKGKACGNTCISRSYTCRTNTPPSSPYVTPLTPTGAPRATPTSSSVGVVDAYVRLADFADVFGATLDTASGNPRVTFHGEAFTLVLNSARVLTAAGETQLRSHTILRDGAAIVPTGFLETLRCLVALHKDARYLLVTCPEEQGGPPAKALPVPRA